MSEFLPLCDLVFNVVSLAAYFCDLVFDLLTIYTLYSNGITSLFSQCLSIVIITSIVTQLVSLHWFLHEHCEHLKKCFIIALHVLQLGMLWRYARLLVPVKLDTVKREVRDLCILRMVHAFLQAAPMLMLQLTLLSSVEGTPPKGGPPADLITVSAALSLFSVCWALASFSKHVQHVERLVLTWLGVIAQLLWRAGTVTARVLALSVYAASYKSWVLLVLLLHWACMFLWLLSPSRAYDWAAAKGIGAGSSAGGSGTRHRVGLCALLAGVYVLAYVNLQMERPHRRTMCLFYVIMMLENALLIVAWLAAVRPAPPNNWYLIPCMGAVLFVTGISFMLLYYRYFHVRRLSEAAAAAAGCHGASSKDVQGGVATTHAGVFNCRFAAPAAAAALYNNHRKKKMPTTFVPPPTSAPFWRRPLPLNVATTTTAPSNASAAVYGRVGTNVLTSAGTTPSGTAVNIHQKLQEKKLQQLAELKMIEEEIKQGKLPSVYLAASQAPSPVGVSLMDGRQPIPRAKRHLDEPHMLSLASLNNLASYGVNLNRRPAPRAPPTTTNAVTNNNNNAAEMGGVGGRRDVGGAGGVTLQNELLLAPRYLFCECRSSGRDAPGNGTEQAQLGLSATASPPPPSMVVGGGGGGGASDDDADSQTSLPRSYTLPREFKYCGGGGGVGVTSAVGAVAPVVVATGGRASATQRAAARRRRAVAALRLCGASAAGMASTNSSDGDVDSSATDDSLRTTPTTAAAASGGAGGGGAAAASCGGGSKMVVVPPTFRRQQMHVMQQQFRHETRL